MNHELILYCEKNKLCELRAFLEKVLTGFHLSDINKNQLILAVEEVCSNLIIHSHGCNPSDHIKLKVKQHKQHIIFEIMDSGEAFNITEYQEPGLEEVLKAKRKGGLGIKLVKKIMDTIEFETSERQNVCRLIKQLKSK